MSICFASHQAKPCTHVALFNHDCEITDRLFVHDIAVEDQDRFGVRGERALQPCGGCAIEQEKPRKRVELPGRPGSSAEIMIRTGRPQLQTDVRLRSGTSLDAAT